MATPPDITAQISALLATGISPDQISSQLLQTAATIATTTSISKIPTNALTPEEQATLYAWLQDGQGTTDVQSELAAMADGILANDPAGQAHLLQAVKNALISLPHIMQDARTRAAQKNA